MVVWSLDLADVPASALPEPSKVSEMLTPIDQHLPSRIAWVDRTAIGQQHGYPISVIILDRKPPG
ncbi:MAG: hypothetical protein HC795_07610 [Coleofasciculaceae cyanobacterium RL_1_1]|nr:hypothetical protein [Coleofasciculaceae cyanobacterium RL_1_1]